MRETLFFKVGSTPSLFKADLLKAGNWVLELRRPQVFPGRALSWQDFPAFSSDSKSLFQDSKWAAGFGLPGSCSVTGREGQLLSHKATLAPAPTRLGSECGMRSPEHCYRLYGETVIPRVLRCLHRLSTSRFVYSLNAFLLSSFHLIHF